MEAVSQAMNTNHITAMVERMRLAMKNEIDETENLRNLSVEAGEVNNCDLCQDKEFIVVNKEENRVSICKCVEIKRNRRILEKCGVSKEFMEKTLDNYEEWNKYASHFKSMAITYVEAMKRGEKKSIAFLGQSGAGKMHLTFAIANELMNIGVPVLYMPYADAIEELKMLNRNSDSSREFRDLMNRYTTASVLLIDDLFKATEDKQGKVNPVDVRYMFNIINERYLKSLPIVISSEYTLMDFVNIDEALGGRIKEMCGKFRGVVDKNREYNFRLRK